MALRTKENLEAWGPDFYNQISQVPITQQDRYNQTYRMVAGSNGKVNENYLSISELLDEKKEKGNLIITKEDLARLGAIDPALAERVTNDPAEQSFLYATLSQAATLGRQLRQPTIGKAISGGENIADKAFGGIASLVNKTGATFGDNNTAQFYPSNTPS